MNVATCAKLSRVARTFTCPSRFTSQNRLTHRHAISIFLDSIEIKEIYVQKGHELPEDI